MRVFIAGCGRSGTTYLKTLLDASEDIFIPAESLCLYDYLKHVNQIPREKLLPLFYDEPQLKSWFKGEINLSLDIPTAIDYIHSYQMKQANAKFWGQKTPRFVRHIDLFNANFNDIRWVLVYRDPRSVVASMIKSKRHTYSVVEAVRRWKRDNSPIISRMKAGNVDLTKYLFVRYESLIEDFEKELNVIYSFLSVDMPDMNQIFDYQYGEKQSRDYKGFKFERNEIRSGLQPKTENIESWRKKLNSREIAYIESECSNEMEFFGYTKGEYSKMSINPIRDLIDRTKVILILWEYFRKWPEYLWKSQKRKLLFKLWCFTTSK